MQKQHNTFIIIIYKTDRTQMAKWLNIKQFYYIKSQTNVQINLNKNYHEQYTRRKWDIKLENCKTKLLCICTKYEQRIHIINE